MHILKSVYYLILILLLESIQTANWIPFIVFPFKGSTGASFPLNTPLENL